MSHVDPDTIIWYKNKRVWRTIFSWFLGALSTLPIILGIVNDQYPTEWAVWAIGQLGAVQAIVTRIMAIDKINILLSYIGLGSAPKEVLAPKPFVR